MPQDTYVHSHILPGLLIPTGRPPDTDAPRRTLRQALDVLCRPETRPDLLFPLLMGSDQRHASAMDHVAMWGFVRLGKLCAKVGGAWMWDDARERARCYDAAVSYGLEYVTGIAPARAVALLRALPPATRAEAVPLILKYANNAKRKSFAGKLAALLSPSPVVSHTGAPSADSGAVPLDATRPQAII